MSATATWRSVALGMALDGQFDVRRQQRVLAQLLEQGRDCTPAEVVMTLQRGYPPTGPVTVRRGRQRLAALGGRFVVFGDDEYPMPLRAAWPQLGAPLWLFASGVPVKLADVPVVAVVGTRTPTLDGLRTAGMVAGALASAGAVVVSGMARGIDQQAHRAALDAGGRTIAVLGTGLGVNYPRGSTDLHAAVATNGALLTELPPGAGARPRQFLARNRIISGLARATIVVEGGPTSGALQTARLAAGQGRDVWAVPGSINATNSQAPLALLRDGAIPLTSVADLLDGLDLHSLPLDSDDHLAAAPAEGAADAAGRACHDLVDGDRSTTADDLATSTARRVFDLLGQAPADTDALVAATRLPAPAVMAAIGQLIADGRAVTTPRGVVRA